MIDVCKIKWYSLGPGSFGQEILYHHTKKKIHVQKGRDM